MIFLSTLQIIFFNLLVKFVQLGRNIKEFWNARMERKYWNYAEKSWGIRQKNHVLIC